MPPDALRAASRSFAILRWRPVPISGSDRDRSNGRCVRYWILDVVREPSRPGGAVARADPLRCGYGSDSSQVPPLTRRSTDERGSGRADTRIPLCAMRCAMGLPPDALRAASRSFAILRWRPVPISGMPFMEPAGVEHARSIRRRSGDVPAVAGRTAGLRKWVCDGMCDGNAAEGA